MTWHRACALGELNHGDLKTVRVEDVEMLLIRHDNGVTAIPPHCPHLRERLETSGLCDGKVLTCMQHMWQWEVESGAPMGAAEGPLLRYPTEVRDDDVYVHLTEKLDYRR